MAGPEQVAAGFGVLHLFCFNPYSKRPQKGVHSNRKTLSCAMPIPVRALRPRIPHPESFRHRHLRLLPALQMPLARVLSGKVSRQLPGGPRDPNRRWGYPGGHIPAADQDSEKNRNLPAGHPAMVHQRVEVGRVFGPGASGRHRRGPDMVWKE